MILSLLLIESPLSNLFIIFLHLLHFFLYSSPYTSLVFPFAPTSVFHIFFTMHANIILLKGIYYLKAYSYYRTFTTETHCFLMCREGFTATPRTVDNEIQLHIITCSDVEIFKLFNHHLILDTRSTTDTHGGRRSVLSSSTKYSVLPEVGLKWSNRTD